MTKTDSIDIFDVVGANIRVESIELEVMRVLPRNNDEVNEKWLADKSRFAYEGLKAQRLDRIYIRDAKAKLVRSCWDQVFQLIKAKMGQTTPEKIAALAEERLNWNQLFRCCN